MDCCPCPGIQKPGENGFIDRKHCISNMVGGDTPPFDWLLLDLLPVDLSSYQQVNDWPSDSMLNNENMETFQPCTLLIYALFLIQIRCKLPLMLMLFLFSSQFSSANLCCLNSVSKIITRTIDHKQNTVYILKVQF